MTQWYALKTLPIARLEFSVMHALHQKERQALVPFEEKWVRQPKTKHRVPRKYVLFPRYVFAGFQSYGDYDATHKLVNSEAVKKGQLPPILGAVRFGDGYPAELSERDVSFLRSLSTPRPTQVNLHKALQVGGKVNIMDGPLSGLSAQIDAVTRKNVTVMLQMFNSMQVVRLPVEAVEAA